MTQRLEDLFNLPETPIPTPKKTGKVKNTKAIAEERDQVMAQMQSIVKERRISLTEFNSKSDIELDDIAECAKQTYDDLMDLGMNVDSRYSARIFEVASAFLKISLDAKSTKVNKVLKSAELEIRQDKGKVNQSNNMVNSDHVVSDRNSLLAKLKKLD